MNITFSRSPNADKPSPYLLLEVLGVLDHSPGLDDCEIADYLHKSAWEVSEALRELARMGLIEPLSP